MALSLKGLTWPPIERFKDVVEDLKKEHWDRMAVEENTAQHNQLAASLGIAATAEELAIAERATDIARKEAAQEAAPAPALAATSLSDNAEQNYMEMLLNGGSSESGLSEAGSEATEAADTPSAKRSRRQPESPSNQNLQRSPHALHDVIADLAQGEGVERMAVDDTDGVVIIEDGVSFTDPAAVEAHRERMAASKAAVQEAAEKLGDAASVAVKLEEIQKADPSYRAHLSSSSFTQAAGSSSAAATVDVTPAAAKLATLRAAAKTMSREEMESLYLACRRRPLVWMPKEEEEEEEGLQDYQTAEVDDADVVRLDAVVAKGTGKSCGSSLGARYSAIHLRRVYIDADGEEQYMEGVPEESITCPDLLFLPDTKQWLSFQVAAHDFVPSKNEMATTLYADSRLVKFDIPRNRAPKTWLTVDTASTASKNIPVRLFEAAEWIKIGSPVQGPCPQAFKTFVAERDAKLVDLQNKCLCEQINFLWLRQHHHTVFLPKPVKALQTWSAQGTDKIMEVTASWASHDIVKQEQDAALKNNKKTDNTVPAQVYNDIVKALPAQRRMAERMGSTVFQKPFQLPVTPLTIQPRESSQTKAKRDRETRSTTAAAQPLNRGKVGRQPGALKRVEVPPTARVSRSQSFPKAVKNTAANAAAKSVTGGLPMPASARPSNDYLPPLAQPTAPNLMPNLSPPGLSSFQAPSPVGSSAASSASYPSFNSHSVQSVAVTEIRGMITEVIENQKSSSVENINERNKMMLELKNEAALLRKELANSREELAASKATCAQLLKSEEQANLHKDTFKEMCNNMLKTIEVLQAPQGPK